MCSEWDVVCAQWQCVWLSCFRLFNVYLIENLRMRALSFARVTVTRDNGRPTRARALCDVSASLLYNTPHHI